MAFTVGDRVNVLPPFTDAMPDVDGGYLVVAVTPFVDGITGVEGETVSIVPPDAPRDFSAEYLAAVTQPG